MRVCFVVGTISQQSGIGRHNRIVSGELARRGIEVYVLVPQVKGQRKRIEQIDARIALSFPYSLLKVFFSQDFFQLPEADIYEIWAPYAIYSYFITRATSKSKHIILFGDPRDREDIKAMTSVDPKLRQFRKERNLKIPYPAYYFYLANLRLHSAGRTISKADAYFCEGKFLIDKVKRMHNLKTEPIFVPHVAEIPNKKPVKSARPTVCSLSRWDPVKRIDWFFDLARHFPSIQFIAMGLERDPGRDEKLWEIGTQIPNLEMPGFVSEERKREILEKSWILVNTSILENVPQAFVEACTYRCALLSAVNPDDFAQNFGYHVQDNNFNPGLEFLLENDRWREKGERGFEYIKENYELNKVIDRRIEIYQAL